ncbi:HAD-IA family hydrolase [Rhodovulum sp. YNF3179]|uniref:HAD-IA family hydrolase n=1 Tax=Rhodovulum sp. YNF3179 TaxID=3425127 RepID=UPI003D326E85
MRTVIFDLDGTLADTSGDLIAAANACFRDMGQHGLLDPARDRLTAFRGGRAMLRLGLERRGLPWSEADVDAAYPRLLEAYEADIDRHTRLYPGALAAVEGLATAGYRVGICTNKPAALAELLLDRLGVRDRFASMIGADTLPVRKPDPAPYLAAVERAGGAVASSLLVGDTETDRETARAAGVPCILVAFGPEGPGLARLDPEALLGHYDDLGRVVAGLIG